MYMSYMLVFVGQKSRYREWFIRYIRSHGIKIQCFGDGWENGRVSYKEMKELFQNARFLLIFLIVYRMILGIYFQNLQIQFLFCKKL